MTWTKDQIEQLNLNVARIANALEESPPVVVPDIDPPIDDTEFKTVTVMVDKAPLRELANLNTKGFPVWGIYGKADMKKRIVAKAGKVMKVVGDSVRGDGGHYAWPLYSGQVVDGKELPGDQRLYILDRHVN